jgi:hypothetical protein
VEGGSAKRDSGARVTYVLCVLLCTWEASFVVLIAVYVFRNKDAASGRRCRGQRAKIGLVQGLLSFAPQTHSGSVPRVCLLTFVNVFSCTCTRPARYTSRSASVYLSRAHSVFSRARSLPFSSLIIPPSTTLASAHSTTPFLSLSASNPTRAHPLPPDNPSSRNSSFILPTLLLLFTRVRPSVLPSRLSHPACSPLAGVGIRSSLSVGRPSSSAGVLMATMPQVFARPMSRVVMQEKAALVQSQRACAENLAYADLLHVRHRLRLNFACKCVYVFFGTALLNDVYYLDLNDPNNPRYLSFISTVECMLATVRSCR